MISIRRAEVRPFTDRQIGLLKTFADQAVIAIENTRLFEEVQARTRELKSRSNTRPRPARCLSVISRSPSEVQPVFDTIAEDCKRYAGKSDNAVIAPRWRTVSPRRFK